MSSLIALLGLGARDSCVKFLKFLLDFISFPSGFFANISWNQVSNKIVDLWLLGLRVGFLFSCLFDC